MSGPEIVCTGTGDGTRDLLVAGQHSNQPYQPGAQVLFKVSLSGTSCKAIVQCHSQGVYVATIQTAPMLLVVICVSVHTPLVLYNF